MTAPHMTPDEFRALGKRMVDWVADYWERVESLPVLARVAPGDVAAMLPERPPEHGFRTPSPSESASEGSGFSRERARGVEAPEASLRSASASGSDSWDEVLGDLERIIVPGLTHWQSPNFFAYFPCNASFPAILGEFLSAGLNVNGMLWATSPAATELETRVLDWMAEMVGLPDTFRSTSANGGGVIQGTASESTLIAMPAARGRIERRTDNAGVGVEGEGEESGAALSVAQRARHLVAYASTQAHSSVVKAAMIAGLARGPEDRAHLRLIETDAEHAMRPDLLAAAMREDRAAGRTPFFVCATVGTTSSTAVDPVGSIAEVMASLDDPSGPSSVRPWLHIDAAHSGCACVCPEFRWMLSGVERADSVCFNPHKWLLTNFDCDCFFTRDRAALTGALSVTPEYLRNAASQSGEVIDYRDWQVPLGRRFRALKLWLVIRHYGVEGLRAHIREHVRLATLFESWVRADERFEVAARRTVNLVCFRLRGEGSRADGRNRALLEAINASGRAHLSHTTLAGRYVLRMAIGATATEERHVRAAWDLIGGLASRLPAGA
ncbi:MAG: pyridoxal-dependent decarboxylase [Phycisphaerales bacterium]